MKKNHGHGPRIAPVKHSNEHKHCLLLRIQQDEANDQPPRCNNDIHASTFHATSVEKITDLDHHHHTNKDTNLRNPNTYLVQYYALAKRQQS
jgi:hypothetical protein